MKRVEYSATAITAKAPSRSSQAARLKKSHHRGIATAQAIAPSDPKAFAPSSGRRGTTNLSTNSRIARTTPGHSRSGFRRVGSWAAGVLIMTHHTPELDSTRTFRGVGQVLAELPQRLEGKADQGSPADDDPGGATHAGHEGPPVAVHTNGVVGELHEHAERGCVANHDAGRAGPAD